MTPDQSRLVDALARQMCEDDTGEPEVWHASYTPRFVRRAYRREAARRLGIDHKEAQACPRCAKVKRSVRTAP